MPKFKTNEKNVLDAYALKQYANRSLSAGYSAAVSADEDGMSLDIYDGDVMIKSIPVEGMSQGEAEKKIDAELEGF